MSGDIQRAFESGDWQPDEREGVVIISRAKYDALMALMAAAKEVLSMSDDFCAGMGPAWEGDPLTDACDKLRAALRAAGIQTEEP